MGIGTFNTNQQRAILEEIEMALKTLPNGERERLEKYFNQEHEEKFFVKNLETIQEMNETLYWLVWVSDSNLVESLATTSDH